MRAASVILFAIIDVLAALSIGRQYSPRQVLAAALKRSVGVGADVLTRTVVVAQQAFVDI